MVPRPRKIIACLVSGALWTASLPSAAAAVRVRAAAASPVGRAAAPPARMPALLPASLGSLPLTAPTAAAAPLAGPEINALQQGGVAPLYPLVARPGRATRGAVGSASPEKKRKRPDGRPQRLESLRGLRADLSRGGEARPAAEGGRVLDAFYSGARLRPSGAPAPGGRASRVRGWLAAAGLALALLSPAEAPARTPAPPPPAAAAERAAAPAVLVGQARGAPARVRVEMERPTFALADAIRGELLIESAGGPASVPVQVLQDGLQSAVGPSFRVLTEQRGEVLALPGRPARVAFELEPVGIPDGLEAGGEVEISAPEQVVVQEGASYRLPAFSFRLRSSLEQGWEDEGYRGVSPWNVGLRMHWGTLALWLAAAGALYYLVRRLNRKPEPEAQAAAPPPSSAGLPARLREEVDLLAREVEEGLKPAEFYRRLTALLGSALSYAYGLSDEEPEGSRATLAELHRRLLAAGRLDEDDRGELWALGQLAQETLYGGADRDKARLLEDAELSRAVISRLEADLRRHGEEGLRGGEAAALGAAALPLLGADFSFGGMAFDQPAWLLLLAPLAGFLAWALLKSRGKKPAFAAPSAELVVRRPPLLRRFSWLAWIPLYAGLALGTIGAADPMWGVKANSRTVTSLDTVLVLDVSGSMDHKLGDARQAAEAFIERQKETTNRVGLVVFDDRGRLAHHLTLEHEALGQALRNIGGGGGTSIDHGVDAALDHFVEMNLIDSDDPRAGRLKRLLRTGDLDEVIAEAQRLGLEDVLLDGGRSKAVVLLSDGQSDPEAAAGAFRRARALGVRIYAVGIPDADQALLQESADATGGRFLWAQDAAAMERAFLDIDALQKAEVRAYGPPERERHGREFAAWAAGLIAVSLVLRLLVFGETARPPKLRKNLLAAVVLFPLAGLAGLPADLEAPRPLLAQAGDDAAPLQRLSPVREPDLVREGRELYEQGRPAEALERFRSAREAYPDMPELPLYEALANRALGDKAAAARGFEEAARLAQSQGRRDVAAATLLEQGNAALADGDAEAARRSYRSAARLPPGGTGAERARQEAVQEAARKNYERLLRQPGGSGTAAGRSGAGTPRPGEGQPGEGQPGEGKPQGPGQGQADGEGRPGQEPGDPQPGQAGEAPAGAAPENAREALEELRKSRQERQGQQGGRSPWPIGRAWALLPILFSLFGAQTASAATGGPALAAAVSFSWAVPAWLTAAAVLLPVLAWAAWRLARRGHLAARALDAGTPAGLWSWGPARRLLKRAGLALAGLGLLMAAAAGPQWGARKESFSYGGQDVAVAVDVSKSVLWEERGSFESSLEGLERLLVWLENGRAGDRIVVFPFAQRAGEGALSEDYRGVVVRLYRLWRDADSIPEGSNLPAAVERAVEAFEAAGDDRGRVLILISDGGESMEGLEEAAALAQRHRVRIHALGVGAEAGSRMRVPEKHRRQVGGEFLPGPGGQPVVVRRNEAPLRLLAGRTGGTYRAAEGGEGMDLLLAGIAVEESARREVEVEIDRSLVAALAAPGVALLLLSLLLGGPGAWRGSRRPELPAAERQARVREAAARLRVSDLLKGSFRSPFSELSGPEAADPVPYTNEPARLVDQRASARSEELFAKRFEPEPDPSVHILLDVSASGRFGSGPFSKREAAAEAAAALALAAAREGMRVGALLFSDRALNGLPPGKGRRHAEAVFRLLAGAPAEGDGTDLAAALRRVLGGAARRGIVIVLSDFSSPDYAPLLAAAAESHVVLPVAVEDVLESAPLPDLGEIALEDAETGEAAVLDASSPAVRREIADRLEARRAALRRASAGRAHRPLFLTTDGSHLRRLVEYFQRREWRQ